MTKEKFSSELVRELAELLNETGLTEIEYGKDDWHIRVAKNVTVNATAAAVAAPAPASAPPTADAAQAPTDLSKHPGAINSPMVGVAYMSPDPDSPAFVSVGDSVSEGQTLCLVEAMKVFNPILAPKAGKVSQILIQSGAPVEYGDTLFVID